MSGQRHAQMVQIDMMTARDPRGANAMAWKTRMMPTLRASQHLRASSHGNRKLGRSAYREHEVGLREHAQPGDDEAEGPGAEGGEPARRPRQERRVARRPGLHLQLHRLEQLRLRARVLQGVSLLRVGDRLGSQIVLAFCEEVAGRRIHGPAMFRRAVVRTLVGHRPATSGGPC